MVDQILNSILDNYKPNLAPLKTPLARREMQYIIDYCYTSKTVSTEQLAIEVAEFYSNQMWYSKLAGKIGICNIPPRIRAFKQELSDRLVVSGFFDD